MNLLDAARQALEALELGYDSAKSEADRYHEAMAGYKPERHAQVDAEVQQIAKAITALRQAIEQAEFDAVHDALEKEAGIHISQQAEQQEPVAWIEHIAGGVEYNPYHKAALKLPEGMRFDLYTTPPQRKPLTDEMVKRMKEVCDSMEMRGAFADGWLSAERAHGIGGGK